MNLTLDSIIARAVAAGVIFALGIVALVHACSLADAPLPLQGPAPSSSVAP